MMGLTVQELYGNRTRLRVCGVCFRNSALLLVNHAELSAGDFWAPPGGGIEFGEDAKSCLAREFREETGLTPTVGDFLFACELVKPPLHAIELFFSVEVGGGEPIRGSDPESGNRQIIREVRFMTQTEFDKLDREHSHGIFRISPKFDQITGLKGYFKL